MMSLLPPFPCRPSRPSASGNPVLKSITELKDAVDVYDVFYDILLSCEFLHEKYQSMHGNITLSNIMCRQGEGRVTGVLCDLDMSFSTRDNEMAAASPTSTQVQRTGTRTFMAIELLRKPPQLHLYRHDLESLFYVMLWHTHRYDNGALVNNPPFEDWPRLSTHLLLREKEYIVSSTTFTLKPTPQHMGLRPLLATLALTLATSFHARRLSAEDPSVLFDHSTLGGYFSFAVVQKIFEECALPRSSSPPSLAS